MGRRGRIAVWNYVAGGPRRRYSQLDPRLADEGDCNVDDDEKQGCEDDWPPP